MIVKPAAPFYFGPWYGGANAWPRATSDRALRPVGCLTRIWFAVVDDADALIDKRTIVARRSNSFIVESRRGPILSIRCPGQHGAPRLYATDVERNQCRRARR